MYYAIGKYAEPDSKGRGARSVYRRKFVKGQLKSFDPIPSFFTLKGLAYDEQATYFAISLYVVKVHCFSYPFEKL